MEYMMLEEEIILCALVDMLADPVLRSRHGQDVVLLLTLLVNYCKYDVSIVIPDLEDMVTLPRYSLFNSTVSLIKKKKYTL